MLENDVEENKDHHIKEKYLEGHLLEDLVDSKIQIPENLKTTRTKRRRRKIFELLLEAKSK